MIDSQRHAWNGFYRVCLVGGLICALMLLTACGGPKPPAYDMGTTGQTAGQGGTQAAGSQSGIQEEGLAAGGVDQLQKEGAQESMGAAEDQALSQFINEDIYFDFDSAQLLPQGQEILRRKAQWLRSHPGASVIIEGHTDERGTVEYNLALGDRRAESAKAFLVELGISPDRISTISYGEERPADPGHDEAAWAKNRRAQFVLEK
jgi:peptidoglycan-associated lipoprotein